MGVVTADLQIRFSTFDRHTPVQSIDEDSSKPAAKLSTQEIIDSAISILEDADHASGDERDFAAFNLATQLRDLGVPQDKALDLMRSVWNPGNTPPLTDAELAKAVDRAYDKNVARAVVLLENAVNAAGDARGEAAFELATQLRDLGVAQDKAKELLADIWNPGNTPPLTDAELSKAVDRAYDKDVAQAVVLLGSATNASGDARADAAFGLASQIAALGVPQDKAKELMTDIWNPGNVPPLADAELAGSITRAHDEAVAQAGVLLENATNASGSARAGAAFNLASQIASLGVPQDKAKELLADNWNSGNIPPITDAELSKAVDRSYDKDVAQAVALLGYASNASGEDKNNTAFDLAAKIEELGVPKAKAVELLADIWNSGNASPLTDAKLDEMVSRAYDEDVARTVVLLRNSANTSGDDRDDAAIKLAKQISVAGVPRDKAVELIADIWNPRNKPPLDDDELADLVDRAYNGRDSGIKDKDKDKDKSVAFDPVAQDSILELVTDGTDQEGNKPVTVEYETKAMAIMKLWAELEWDGDHGLSLLKMLDKGEKRVKIFCPVTMDRTIKIFVDNDSTTVASTGRRHDMITETLAWTGDTQKRLKYGYDQPDVTITQKTFFRDSTGRRIADPTYDRSKGMFYTSTEAIGALIVQYKPGYSLFNIKYGTGEELVSGALFEEMQKCWLYGDIHKASVPPVRLVAISDKGAVSAQFERSFWPNGFPGIKFNEKKLKDLYLEVQGTRETVTKMVPLNTEEPGTMYGVKHTTYVEGKNADGRSFALRFLS